MGLYLHVEGGKNLLSGKWDRSVKRLILEKPQDIVSWLLPGARVVGVYPQELHSRDILADLLFEVVVDGKRYLLHIEFQARSDAKMAERLLEYNVLAEMTPSVPFHFPISDVKRIKAPSRETASDH